MALGRKKPDRNAPRINPASAKNAVAVAKVVVPVVLPVIAPFAVQAAGVVRDRVDRRRARKLGVAVDDLASFSGRGGALHARIAGAADAVTDLRARPDASSDTVAFADQTANTLTQLTAAVRAAERMPTARRKAAHKAVAAELDQVEQRLLNKLGV